MILATTILSNFCNWKSSRCCSRHIHRMSIRQHTTTFKTVCIVNLKVPTTSSAYHSAKRPVDHDHTEVWHDTFHKIGPATTRISLQLCKPDRLLRCDHCIVHIAGPVDSLLHAAVSASLVHASRRMGFRCPILPLPWLCVVLVACFWGSRGVAASPPEWQKVLWEREVNRTVIIIPTTFVWLSFAMNAFCSLQRVGRNETVILALDAETHTFLRQNGMPVYMDPALSPTVAPGLDNVLYGKVGHSRMMCSKLAAVLNILLLGLNVLYCDSDIYVHQDPLAQYPALDLTFQFGGMGDPKMAGAKNYGSLACFPEVYQAGPCKINAGWFFAYPRPKVLQFLGLANQTCFARHSNDQYTLSMLLHGAYGHSAKAEDLPVWGCYDPCKYANGRTFFVYCRPQLEQVDPVMVHANWITHSRKTGVVYKKRLLWLYKMWNPSCIDLPLGKSKVKQAATRTVPPCDPSRLHNRGSVGRSRVLAERG